MKDLNVSTYEFGNFCLLLKKRQLLKDGTDVSLTKKSFDILIYLIENRDRVVKKEELLEHCWDEDFVEESNITQNIYRIRKALKSDENEDEYIKTTSKFGYRFVAGIKLQTRNPNNNDQKDTHQSKVSIQSRNKENGLEETRSNYQKPIIKESDLDNSHNASNKKRWLLITSSLLLTFLLGTYFIYFKSQNNGEISNIKSIAILPFTLIGEGSDEKLGLGMADTIISKLSNQNKIEISPTVTIIKFVEKQNQSPINIGEQLDVDAILVGTIQKENDTVRVNIQIIDVKENKPIWSEKFDSKYSDIFSLQDELSQHIARKLSLDLNDQRDSSLAIKHSKNIEAYKAYSNGLFHWSKRTSNGLSKALEYFQTAIDKDPEFANAYAFLADTYSLIGYNKYDLIPEQEAMNKAEEFANKALELDSNSSEAIATLALVNMYEKRMDNARLLLKKAIELKPNNKTAHLRLSWINAVEGDLGSAIQEMKIAYKSDPQSDQVHSILASYLLLARKPDEAFALAQRILETTPPSNNMNILLAEIYEQKDEYKKAIGELETIQKKEPKECFYLLGLSRLYAKDNRMAESRKVLNEALNFKVCQEANFLKALAYLYLGENNKVLPLIKKDKNNPWHLIMLKNDHNLDPIRNTTEFQAYLSQAKSK